MKRKGALLGVVVAGLLPFAGLLWYIFRPPTVELRWKLKPGQTLHYRVEANASWPRGACETVDQEDVTVHHVGADGSLSISQVVQNMTLQQTDPKINYSSERKDPLPEDAEARSKVVRVGIPIRIRMNPRGQILSLEGLEEAEAKRTEALRPIAFLEGFSFPPLSEPIFLTTLLPQRSVAIGDRWSEEGQTDLGIVGMERWRKTWTLHAVTGDVAELRMSTETLERTPGKVEAMTGPIPPPAPPKIFEVAMGFSISRGLLLSFKSRIRIESTSAKGTLFFFELREDRRLVEE